MEVEKDEKPVNTWMNRCHFKMMLWRHFVMVLKDGARERNGCYKIKKTRGEKNVKY